MNFKNNYMELTPKFKKPKKQRTRTGRIPSHVLPTHLEQLEILSDYANLSKNDNFRNSNK